MKASILLVVSGAVLALAAGPLNKRVIHTEIVTDIVYVTVTKDITPSSSSFFRQVKESATSTSTSTSTSTTSTYSPPPPPPPPEPTTAEIPQPTTEQQAVVPTPEPTTGEVVVVTQAQPSVQAATQQEVVKTQPTANSAAPNDFVSTAVYHHNIHRENNSAPAIRWGEKYAGYAGQTAKRCKFEHDLTPGGGSYGQNLAMWASSGDAKSLGAGTAIARAITDMWYNGEIELYPRNAYGQQNPDFSKFEAWGHYSQVVWVGSEQVGCAAEFCPPGTMFPNMGAWFSVCNYYPAGNMGGQYGNNVLRPLGKQTINA